MLEEEALLNEMREKLDIYSFDWKEDLVNWLCINYELRIDDMEIRSCIN
jgi:hypothetical protein